MKSDTTFAASGYASGDIQLFRDVTDIDRLIGDFPVCQFAAGVTVPAVVGGDALLYVVLQGALKVSMQTVVDKVDAAADICGEVLPGECVGELSVLGGERRGICISAIQTTDVLVIDAAGLWKLIDELSGFARKLLMLRSVTAPTNGTQSGNQEARVKFPKKGSMNDIGLGSGLQNRTWLDEHLLSMTNEAHETNKPFSMLMINLGCADQVIESTDHVAWDEAFKMASNVIIDSIRPSDFAVRYSDNEIAVILPNANAQGATMVAQRLSERISKAVISADTRESLQPISASFGVACLAPKQGGNELIAASAAALNRAKRAGKAAH